MKKENKADESGNDEKNRVINKNIVLDIKKTIYTPISNIKDDPIDYKTYFDIIFNNKEMRESFIKILPTKMAFLFKNELLKDKKIMAIFIENCNNDDLKYIFKMERFDLYDLVYEKVSMLPIRSKFSLFQNVEIFNHVIGDDNIIDKYSNLEAELEDFEIEQISSCKSTNLSKICIKKSDGTESKNPQTELDPDPSDENQIKSIKQTIGEYMPIIKEIKSIFKRLIPSNIEKHINNLVDKYCIAYPNIVIHCIIEEILFSDTLLNTFSILISKLPKLFQEMFYFQALKKLSLFKENDILNLHEFNRKYINFSNFLIKSFYNENINNDDAIDELFTDEKIKNEDIDTKTQSNNKNVNTDMINPVIYFLKESVKESNFCHIQLIERFVTPENYQKFEKYLKKAHLNVLNTLKCSERLKIEIADRYYNISKIYTKKQDISIKSLKELSKLLPSQIKDFISLIDKEMIIKGFVELKNEFLSKETDKINNGDGFKNLDKNSVLRNILLYVKEMKEFWDDEMILSLENIREKTREDLKLMIQSCIVLMKVRKRENSEVLAKQMGSDEDKIIGKESNLSEKTQINKKENNLKTEEKFKKEHTRVEINNTRATSAYVKKFDTYYKKDTENGEKSSKEKSSNRVEEKYDRMSNFSTHDKYSKYKNAEEDEYSDSEYTEKRPYHNENKDYKRNEYYYGHKKRNMYYDNEENPEFYSFHKEKQFYRDIPQKNYDEVGSEKDNRNYYNDNERNEKYYENKNYLNYDKDKRMDDHKNIKNDEYYFAEKKNSHDHDVKKYKYHQNETYLGGENVDSYDRNSRYGCFGDKKNYYKNNEYTDDHRYFDGSKRYKNNYQKDFKSYDSDENKYEEMSSESYHRYDTLKYKDTRSNPRYEKRYPNSLKHKNLESNRNLYDSKNMDIQPDFEIEKNKYTYKNTPKKEYKNTEIDRFKPKNSYFRTDLIEKKIPYSNKIFDQRKDDYTKNEDSYHKEDTKDSYYDKYDSRKKRFHNGSAKRN